MLERFGRKSSNERDARRLRSFVGIVQLSVGVSTGDITCISGSSISVSITFQNLINI